MPDTLSDGAVIFGSQILTIGSYQYVAEQIEVVRPVVITDMVNETKVVTKGLFIKQRMVGSAILQLPNATTPAPILGFQFSIVPIGGGYPRPFFITEVSEVFSSDAATKVRISIVEVIDGNQILNPLFPDGDLTIPQAAGPLRVTKDLVTSGYEARQLWQVYATYYSPLSIGSSLPSNGNFFLTEETPVSEYGNGLVQWERVYNTLPPARYETRTYVKTYKTLLKVVQTLPAVGIIAATITSRTAPVKVNVTYYYSRNPVGSFGEIGIPDVSIVTVGPYTFIDHVFGFPFDTTPYNNSNYFPHSLANNVTRWKGDIYQQELLFG